MLGMGTLIQGPEGLPMLKEGGGVPDNLPENFGALIVPSCGFAQARVGEWPGARSDGAQVVVA